jgi:hypothetical protein
MFKAFQASDMGSIPISRSINRDDSIVLTPLRPLISAIKLGVLVPGWSQRNKLVPTSQPEVTGRGLLFGLSARPKDQARFLILLDEPLDDRQSRTQEILDFFGRTVGGAKPNELGWLAVENATFLKIRILGNDRETIVLGILPNSGIVRVPNPHL